ncbi:hypothetical protein PGIGA_G00251610 [Pangasianodon gigas]|uniref:Uncharacterized protein n=1 Tax=Pangasianodon gigas TaxID=30993 RepID=A0ACC5WS16_PANGG|nr:hypothetical protein [Pangasianodon gigas]
MCLCAGSQVISTQIGFTAVLPCQFNNEQIRTPHVQWCTDAEIVFEGWNGKSYVGEGYEGHVDVPEDELLKGNCSLTFKNVRKSDAGIYRSYLLLRHAKTSVFKEWRLIGSVEVSVDEPKETPKKPTASDYAGMTSPQPLVRVVSLLSWLLFPLFSK